MANIQSYTINITNIILSGYIDPDKGCTFIGDINHALDWPEELSAIGMLAHEQYDHEKSGITAKGCIPEIIDECKSIIVLSPHK